MKILAIDLGYSAVKVARYNDSGALELDKFISCTARVDKPLEMDDENLFQLGTNYYTLGSAAIKVPRANQIQIDTWEGLLEIYPVWISYLMKKYGSFDKIALGVSLAFKDKVDELLDVLERELMISRDFFMVLPQGLIAKKIYADYALNINEASKKNDIRMNNYLIVDIGFLTIDCSNVIDGVASSSSTIGLAGTGVINIAYDLKDYLYKINAWNITVKEAQIILDNDGVYKRRGVIYDFKDKVKEFSLSYLTKVLTLIEDNFSDCLDNMEGVLILGGGAYIFQKNFKDISPEIEKHFPVEFLKFPEVQSEFYNVYGFLKAAYQLAGETK